MAWGRRVGARIPGFCPGSGKGVGSCGSLTHLDLPGCKMSCTKVCETMTLLAVSLPRSARLFEPWTPDIWVHFLAPGHGFYLVVELLCLSLHLCQMG